MLYPELEKMKAVNNESQSIGQFLEWLDERGLAVCKITEHHNPVYMPTTQGIEGLLAEYFSIDLVKVENEKRKILEGLQNA